MLTMEHGMPAGRRRPQMQPRLKPRLEQRRRIRCAVMARLEVAGYTMICERFICI
jgi:hypothetical protein